MILVVPLLPLEPTLFGFSTFCSVWTTFGQESLSQPQDTQGQTHLQLALESQGDSFIDVIVVSVSFLVD